MKATVSLRDVVNEMDVLSDEHSAFLNRHTGELVTITNDEISDDDDDDNIDEYPEWQQDMIIKAKEVMNSDDYLEIPSKFEIHEFLNSSGFLPRRVWGRVQVRMNDVNSNRKKIK